MLNDNLRSDALALVPGRSTESGATRRTALQAARDQAEIAARTGFAHPEYLGVVWRRQHGASPAAWRAQAK